MAEAECPSCDAKVQLSRRPTMGMQVTCPTCDAPLEVVWLDPLELDWAYDDDEYEYDDEEDLEDIRY